MPYGAQLLLGVSPFPDRTYNGTLFPAGPYDALQIVLGEGAGHNWWCVLYPSLCYPEACLKADVQYRMDVTLTRAGPTDPDPPAAAAPTPFIVTFESDILAFLRKHFGRR